MARVTPDTQRQGARIRELREALDVSKPLMASRLKFESTQSLELYERGISVIRFDQLRLWAAAFEMAEVDFVNAVFGDDPITQDDWSFRTALRGHIPEDLIDELAEDWEGRPLTNQKSAVEGILRLAERQRRDATSPRAKTTPSAHAV